jgi:hypothetical protein
MGGLDIQKGFEPDYPRNMISLHLYISVYQLSAISDYQPQQA